MAWFCHVFSSLSRGPRLLCQRFFADGHTILFLISHQVTISTLNSVLGSFASLWCRGVSRDTCVAHWPWGTPWPDRGVSWCREQTQPILLLILSCYAITRWTRRPRQSDLSSAPRQPLDPACSSKWPPFWIHEYCLISSAFLKKPPPWTWVLQPHPIFGLLPTFALSSL